WPTDSDPGLWTTDSARLFEGTAPAIPCLAGDQIKVYITQTSGEAQELASATLALYLVDRTDVVAASQSIDVATYRTTTSLSSHPVNLPSASAGDLLIGVFGH